MINKIQLPAPVKVENDDDLKVASNQIAEARVTLRGMTAQRDREIQAIQEEHNSNIDSLVQAVKALEAPAKRYIKKHKKRLFPGEKKTSRTELATLKIKVNPPKVSAIGKVKEADIASDLHAQGLDHLITVVPALNKSALMKLSDEKLKEYGLKRSQTETISITASAEEKSTAAA